LVGVLLRRGCREELARRDRDRERERERRVWDSMGVLRQEDELELHPERKRGEGLLWESEEARVAAFMSKRRSRRGASETTFTRSLASGA
jgi:hypothetical protein